MMLVVYDISDNKIRNKFTKYMENKGMRLQKSVFVIESTDIKRTEIENHIKQFFNINKNKDDNMHISIFRICESCYKKSTLLGEQEYILNDTIFL